MKLFKINSLCSTALVSALPLVLATSPVMAQTVDEDGSGAESDPHERGSIIVSADALSELDFVAGKDVLAIDAIQQNLSGQIGDVLVKVPGVSATGFAPGASRPILRGLDGERVRILLDGIGIADVGNTSADHATTIDPLTVERIEVLRSQQPCFSVVKQLGAS